MAGAGTAAMGYDALGRLLFTVAGGAPNLTYLDYDGSALNVERLSGGGAIQRRYVYGPGEEAPLVWYEGVGTNDRRWLHADERGSVIAVSDASGAAIVINKYDEYGIPAAGNMGRFQYTGQMWLPQVGLYHYKARAYSPSLGRFMQTDPIGYAAGTNLTAYVGGDPVNFVDPSGLAGCGVPTSGALNGHEACNGDDLSEIVVSGRYNGPNFTGISISLSPNSAYGDLNGFNPGLGLSLGLDVVNATPNDGKGKEKSGACGFLRTASGTLGAITEHIGTVAGSVSDSAYVAGLLSGQPEIASGGLAPDAVATTSDIASIVFDKWAGNNVSSRYLIVSYNLIPGATLARVFAKNIREDKLSHFIGGKALNAILPNSPPRTCGLFK